MIDERRDHLDEAIDRVATKMVARQDDAGELQALIARLPERESTHWFLKLPVQATAAALVLAALFFARPADDVPATAPGHIGESALAAVREPAVETVAEVAVPVESTPGARLRTPESPIPAPWSPSPDHERSLAPVAAIEALELTEIAAPAIELDAPASLEPLVLTDLSLETKGES